MALNSVSMIVRTQVYNYLLVILINVLLYLAHFNQKLNTLEGATTMIYVTLRNVENIVLTAMMKKFAQVVNMDIFY